MAHRTSSIRAVALLCLLAQPAAHAVDRCSARIDQKTGAVLVNATGLGGALTWSGSIASEGIPFADAATCVVDDRARRCRLGESGSLAEMTPPAECRVCVHDDGGPCCAFLKGCTPGPRLKDASFAANDPRACQGAAATDPACGPIGVWELVSGLVQLGYVRQPDLLVLEPDGTARMNTRLENGALRCEQGLFTKGAGREIVLDPSRGGASVLRFRFPADDALELADAGGHTTAFARLAAAPPDLLCRSLVEVSRLGGVPMPTFRTGLAFDGGLLWYTDGTGAEVSVDPQTGVPGPTLALDGVIQAAHGGTFWMLDATPSRSDVVRMRRTGTSADVVTTPGAVGSAPIASAIAVDPSRDLLFLGTSSQTGDAHPLFQVLVGGEPDQFAAEVDVRHDLNAMTFDGTSLWALANARQLFRVDPATGVVRETFELPDDVIAMGVAAVGGDLFLIGASFQGAGLPTGVLLRVRAA